MELINLPISVVTNRDSKILQSPILAKIQLIYQLLIIHGLAFRLANLPVLVNLDIGHTLVLLKHSHAANSLTFDTNNTDNTTIYFSRFSLMIRTFSGLS